MKTKEKAIFLRDDQIQPYPLSDLECIYIGDEFCERRLPSILTLENIHNWFENSKLKLTLATPYLTDEGIKKLTQILDFILDKNLSFKEVVINDWGALKLLTNYDDRFQAVLGRILVSRFTKNYDLEKIGLPNYQKDTNNVGLNYLFPDSFLDFVKKQNICRLGFNSYYHLAITKKQLLEYGQYLVACQDKLFVI